MNGNFSHCEICDGNHDSDQCQDLLALRAMACSRPILEDLVLAIERYVGGASMMHPRLTRAVMRAKDHLRGTNEREGNHYGSPNSSENVKEHTPPPMESATAAQEPPEGGCRGSSCCASSSSYVVYPKGDNLEIIHRTSRDGQTEIVDCFSLPLDAVKKAVLENKIILKENDVISEVHQGGVYNIVQTWHHLGKSL